MAAPVVDALGPWPHWRRDELAANTANGPVGMKLVAETEQLGQGDGT